MASLAFFFGRSPYEPLLRHIEKATVCAEVVPALFEYLFADDLVAFANQRIIWSPVLV